MCVPSASSHRGKKKTAQLHGAIVSGLPISLCPSFSICLYVLCVGLYVLCAKKYRSPRREIQMHASWAMHCIPLYISLYVYMCIWPYVSCGLCERLSIYRYPGTFHAHCTHTHTPEFRESDVASLSIYGSLYLCLYVSMAVCVQCSPCLAAWVLVCMYSYVRM
jgi:hypothetical protein